MVAATLASPPHTAFRCADFFSEVALAGRIGGGQMRPGLCLAFQGNDLVRIDAHHQVSDVIIDFREPVTRACRNDDHVAGVELVGFRILDGAGVEAGTVLFADGHLGIGPLFCSHQIRAGKQRGGALNDVIDLADLLVLGNGLSGG